MMDDLTLFMFIGFGAVIVMGGGYLLGRYFDPFWRCKVLRERLKRNYLVARLINKDTHSIFLAVINAENDKIVRGDRRWYVSAGRMWREREIKTGESKALLKNKSVNILDVSEYVEGVPVVNLDDESLEPVNYESVQSPVKPREMSAFLQADWMNEMAKMISANKNTTLMLQLMLIGVVISLYFSFTINETVNRIDATQKAQQGQIDLIIQNSGLMPSGGKYQNGSIVIKQGG